MSVALAVGLSVYNILSKEIQLSDLGRESEIAFYAADSGGECALYWDIHSGPLSTTTPSTIKCAGQTLTAGGSTISTFKVGFTNGACAKVVINKSNPPKTIVDSYGYNVDCDTATSSQKVERGVELNY